MMDNTHTYIVDLLQETVSVLHVSTCMALFRAWLLFGDRGTENPRAPDPEPCGRPCISAREQAALWFGAWSKTCEARKLTIPRTHSDMPEGRHVGTRM